jgi:hypothetical protein
LPTLTETNLTTATDPGDYGSVFKAPRASQVANLPPRRTTRIGAPKRTHTQAKLSHGRVYPHYTPIWYMSIFSRRLINNVIV